MHRICRNKHFDIVIKFIYKQRKISIAFIGIIRYCFHHPIFQRDFAIIWKGTFPASNKYFGCLGLHLSPSFSIRFDVGNF